MGICEVGRIGQRFLIRNSGNHEKHGGKFNHEEHEGGSTVNILPRILSVFYVTAPFQSS
jgi:hypothetical protein